MKVLCVAEKPSIAKSITQILSGGRFETRQSSCKYIKNYDFDYGYTNSQFVVTSVLGHLKEHDFEAHHGWNDCDPFALFDAPVKAFVPEKMKAVERNLINEARTANTLMIWTDCDREGEHIGMEIATVCRKVKVNIVVKRARFSAIIAQQIHNAAQHPVNLDQAQADAVEARTILDLKIGAAFTRMQTKNLRGTFQELANGVISYGPCQFPTLGFVVAQHNKVKAFVPETFCYIYLALNYERDETKVTEFNWKRGHLFDPDAALVIYEEVLSNPTARVISATTKPTSKWKPLPLTTVEFQKAASRLIKLTPKKALDIAEKLYQNGYISYPRTETDQYDPQFDFMSLIRKHKDDPNWGPFATELDGGGFQAPRKGKNNDKAHPPIHPTAHVSNLTGDDKKVYDYIVRRFLASCSRNAEGKQTTVDIECGGEEFRATGLVVLEENYLRVYPYEKWTGHSIPNFEVGQEFQPSICELREGQTSKPNLVTEADLVTLMDKHGIGTDATIAQHIATVIDRQYVIERQEGSTKYLVPSTLGIGLVEGYSQIGFEKNLSKPFLRRDTERSMVEVCNSTKSKGEMLGQAIDQYKDMFILASGQFDSVVASVRRNLHRANAADGNDDAHPGGDGGGGGPGDDGGGNGGGNGGGRPGRGAAKSAVRGGTTRSHTGSRSTAARTSSGSGPSTGPDYKNKPQPPPPPPPPAPPTTTRHPIQSATPKRVESGREILCYCDVPAVMAPCSSDSQRQRMKCPLDECEFFFYVNPPSPTRGPRPSVPIKRAHSSIATEEPEEQQGPPRKCFCNEDGVLHKATTEANMNRRFWSCAKPRDTEDRCSFFEWDDEPPKSKVCFRCNKPGHFAAACPNASTACYKCGKEGHYSGTCSNQQSSTFKRTKTTNNSTFGVQSLGPCFKCGKEGHYSKDCPSGDAYSTRGSMSRSKSAGGSSTTSDSCFKCGKAGHWANDCPVPGNGGGSTAAFSRSSRGRGTGRGRGTKRGRGATKSTGRRSSSNKKGSLFDAVDDY